MRTLTLSFWLKKRWPLLAALLIGLFWGPTAKGNGFSPSASLRERVTHPRWLSLPESRLVVNPRLTGYGADATTASHLTPLSLDLAYYVGEEPVRLPGFWSWQTHTTTLPRPSLHLPLDTSAATDWQANGVSPQLIRDGLRLTVTAPAYGSVTRTVTVDLTKTPLLRLNAAGGTGLWALKVNARGKTDDIPLMLDTNQTGIATSDISAATGWQGVKTFQVKLFAVGGRGKTATFSDAYFLPRPDVLQSSEGEIVWFPHQITSRAAAAGNKLRVDSTVFLPDTATVAQSLHILQNDGTPLCLTGRFAAGRVCWDAEHRVLRLQGKQFQVLVRLSRPARWLGGHAFDRPAEKRRDETGTWALALDGVKKGDRIIVTARFTPTLDASASTAAGVPMTPVAFSRALRGQQEAWDRRLAHVPHPRSFTLRILPSLGVTSADVRRTYYRAWVFLLSNLLPSMPENGFPFPQCPTGKPSLWSEGAPHARASAQWESFIALQSLALVQPRIAWDAYTGLLSLVGPDGSLSGEGLPACHVQTAWCLYEMTGDTARLRRLYPTLKRLLLWKANDPRWLYHGATPPGQKDQQFVAHALSEMVYARRIAYVLAMPDEEEFWQAQRRHLADDFGRWFWETPGGDAFRLYDAATGVRSGAGSAWNLAALSLPADVLSEPERKSLLASFQAQWQPNLPFLVAGLSRFTDYQGTQRGVFENGIVTQATMMADAAARDVTRAGEFSEVYDQSSSPPHPNGVRPSVFGARHVIDSVLWLNGVVCDEGQPVLIGTTQTGGVDGLHVRGEPIRITYTNHHRLLLEGLGLRYLRRPVGFVAIQRPNGLPGWRGTIGIGHEVRLEDRPITRK